MTETSQWKVFEDKVKSFDRSAFIDLVKDIVREDFDKYNIQPKLSSSGNPSFGESIEAKIDSKPHILYLVGKREGEAGYLQNIGTKTMVIEPVYIDAGFLQDHCDYYNLRFPEYARHCRRIHFFENEKETVLDVMKDARCTSLDKENKKDLQKGYLGFMVIKPLSDNMVGRTCLKPYKKKRETEAGTRYFPACRPYEVNLYGIQLRIDSLAFQEQDRRLAACATSASWVVFQKTSYDWQHEMPYLAKITRAATDSYSARLGGKNNQRIFPNSGLSAAMMIQALRAMYGKLDPTYIDLKVPKDGLAENHAEAQLRQNLRYVAEFSFAYLKAGIPLLLIMARQKKKERKVERERHGRCDCWLLS